MASIKHISFAEGCSPRFAHTDGMWCAAALVMCPVASPVLVTGVKKSVKETTVIITRY